MCQLEQRLKLCTCAADIDTTQDHWVLERRTVNQKPAYQLNRTMGMFGTDAHIDLMGVMLQQLNEGNCFDFHYEPMIDDRLTIKYKGIKLYFEVKPNDHGKLQFRRYPGFSEVHSAFARHGALAFEPQTELNKKEFIDRYLSDTVKFGTLSHYYDTEFVANKYLDSPLQFHRDYGHWPDILKQHSAKSCTVMTAFNPYSQSSNRWLNHIRQSVLAIDLKLEQHKYIKGVGRSLDGKWVEPSFFVFDLKDYQINTLLVRYQQTAAVYVSEAHLPKLIINPSV